MGAYLDVRLHIMHRSDGRFTRLYTTILVLCLFTQFTFAQEAKVHGHDWAYKLNTGPKHKRDANKAPDLPDDISIEELIVDHGVETDDFVANGNTTRTYADVPTSLGALCLLVLGTNTN